MDKIWDRKSFKVVGRCCGNEKNTQIRQKSNAKKKNHNYLCAFLVQEEWTFGNL